MDTKRIKDLKALAKEQKENHAKAINDMKAWNDNRSEKFRDFRELFNQFKEKTLKPFVEEANNIFYGTGLQLKYLSDDIAVRPEHRLTSYFTIYLYPNGLDEQIVGTRTYFISFLGVPDKGLIQITVRLTLDKYTSTELLGEYKIKDLNAEMVQEIITDFIRHIG